MGANEATRDWSRWLPPKPLPDTGPKVLREGAIVAWRINLLGEVCRMTDDVGNAVVLATSSKYTSKRTNSLHRYGQVRIVQDVGQPEPTPPEVLYASPAVSPAPAVGQRWRDKVCEYFRGEPFTLRGVYTTLGWWTEETDGRNWVPLEDFASGRLQYVDSPSPDTGVSPTTVCAGQRRKWKAKGGRKFTVMEPDARDALRMRIRFDDIADAHHSYRIDDIADDSVLLDEPQPAPCKTPEEIQREVDEATARISRLSAARACGSLRLDGSRCAKDAGHDGLCPQPLCEVSTDGGRTYLPFTLLHDPDPFSSYDWKKVDGVLQLSAWAQHVVTDRLAAENTEALKLISRQFPKPASPPQPQVQSFDGKNGCLGVWLGRAPRP